MKPTTITVLGCGDLGQRLASQLPADHYRVVGLRRQPCQHAAIDYRQADCGDLTSLERALPTDCDSIILTLTPSERSDQGYAQAYVKTVDNLLTLLEQRASRAPDQPLPKRIIFVSSTSVYAQRNGETVNECSPTEPQHFSGQRLLQAEQRLQRSPLFSDPATVIVVRFSGIYGPGRQRLIQQVIDRPGAPTESSEEPVYSNRIHADDCAGVLAHLLQIKSPHPLYLASDCEPVPLSDVKRWLAQQLGLPEQPRQPRPSASNTDSGNQGHANRVHSQTRRSSKRCDNRRLLDSGFEFRYPTFREGYAQVLEGLELDRPAKDNHRD